MIEKIIFVTYINRSGSTFFVNNLSKSENILVCPEAEILIDLFLKDPAKSFNPDKRFFNTLFYAIARDNKLKFWEFNKKDNIQNIENEKTCFDAFVALVDIYRKKVNPTATTLVFKAEKLIYYYPVIHPLSKQYNIKFIAIIRDCRSIFHSQNNTCIPETGKLMGKNSFKLARRWNAYVRLVARFSENDDFFDMSYELLIKEYPGYLLFICKILDIDTFSINNPGDLKHRMPGSHAGIHPLMDAGPDPDRTDIWRNNLNTTQLYIIESVCSIFLQQRGYKLVNVNKHIFPAAIARLVLEYFSFLFSKIFKAIVYRFC